MASSTVIANTPVTYMNGGKSDLVLSPLFSPLSFSGYADDSMTKRQKIVKEIFESEQSYISQLKTIIKLFLEPIRMNCLLPTEDISGIFSNIEGIMAVNVELMRTMRQHSVGEAFTHLGPFMKLYSSYSSNFHNALQVLEKHIKSNANFAGFIMTQESRPECCFLKLSALLITPIQRIPRYKLLLEDLLKNTKVTHLEYSKLNAALQQIEVVANHMNDYIKNLDNSKRMLELQRKFAGSFIPDIITPGRHFIQEGRLMKVCKRKPKERVVFVFSDMMLYARPSNLLDFKTLKYSCRGFIPLLSSEVHRINKDIRVPGITDLIQIVSLDKSITLFSYKEQEVSEWFELIGETIRNLQMSFATFLVQPSAPRVTLRSMLESTTESNNSTFESSYPLTPGTPMYNLAGTKFFPEDDEPEFNTSSGSRPGLKKVHYNNKPSPHFVYPSQFDEEQITQQVMPKQPQRQLESITEGEGLLVEIDDEVTERLRHHTLQTNSSTETLTRNTTVTMTTADTRANDREPSVNNDQQPLLENENDRRDSPGTTGEMSLRHSANSTSSLSLNGTVTAKCCILL